MNQSDNLAILVQSPQRGHQRLVGGVDHRSIGHHHGIDWNQNAAAFGASDDANAAAAGILGKNFGDEELWTAKSIRIGRVFVQHCHERYSLRGASCDGGMTEQNSSVQYCSQPPINFSIYARQDAEHFPGSIPSKVNG